LVFGAFLASLLWALSFALLPFSNFNRRRFTPLALALVALSIFVFTPFTEIHLKSDFHTYRQRREEAAQRILSSATTGNSTPEGQVEFQKLPETEKSLSDDGEVMVARQKRMVFFFTFRGVLAHFSGFVYSVTDAPPGNADFEGEGDFVETSRLSKNWYWVASI
jgi:hypothetical protein